MPSNYPPGVTGNEPEIAGEVNLPAEYTVTFKVKVRVPGEGRMYAIEAEVEAVLLAAHYIVTKQEERNLFDGYINIEVQ